MRIRLQTYANMRNCLTKFSRIFECGAVFLLDSKGPKMCKSCRSRQELSNEYSLANFGVTYSRERASQSLPKISQKLENIFALATDFFFKVGPRGWVGWEDASSPSQFLESVFSV